MDNCSEQKDVRSEGGRGVRGRTSGFGRKRVLWLCACGVLVLLLMTGAGFSQQLVGEGKIFIRFTNVRSDDAKILVRVHVVPNSNKPFGWAGWTIYVGTEEGGRGELDGKWLGRGERSGWVDIGRGMNLRGTRSPDTYLSPVLCGVETSGQKSGLHLLAEVAEGRGQRVIRRVEVHKGELREGKERSYPWVLGYSVWNGGRPFLPTLGLLIPSRPEIASRVYTLAEALEWQLDFIEEFPRIGRRPTRFVFTSRGQPGILDALGYNGYPDGTVEGNFGDEIWISVSMPVDEQNRRFREYLKGKGFDPLEFVGDEELENARQMGKDEQWGLVKITPSLPEKPKQYYESANYRYELWYEELAGRTKALKEKHPGKRVLTGANFSPHMNVWPDVRQWVGPFRAGAMTMTWTEDWWWQIPEVSPQVYGFLLDALRLAGSYHGAPAQFYVMPFTGNSPDNFRRMNALGLAHNVKILNHFHTEAQVLTTWDYVSVTDSPRTYQAIYDVIGAAGAVEHRLYPAQPRRARIAIMLPRASDTWDTEDIGGSGHLYSAKYNVNNEERKAIWLALRHAQYPVDLITDEDIAEGLLKPYKALYIVGSEMVGAAAGPLEKWVADGGVVYATAGGGLLDEYHRELTELYGMYGIEGHELVRHRRHIRPRQTLKEVKALDRLVVKAIDRAADEMKLPVYLYRETLDAEADGEVVGTYAGDNSAGVVANRFGKGRTIYCGALAGMAYVKPAVTRTSQILPTAFSQDVRRFLTVAARWAGVVSPVQVSDPLVEAQYFSGPEGDIVVLINWRDEVVKELVIRFPGRPEIERVRSLRAAGYFEGHLHEQEQGALDLRQRNGAAEVKLDLAISDYLLLD
ncbi:MAG: beta-galactosidase trimerization domain-containing protein [Planctomycetes bacterium]|nr:beta-galactosidase trimerization domain-containing protein [Planctomycetota bacterium]